MSEPLVAAMAAHGIPPERVRRLNAAPTGRGAYVLYWMQQSQREAWNHALEFAILRANQADLPVMAVFGLTDAFPEANLRHYTFMLEGLWDAARALEKRGIRLIWRRGDPARVALSLGENAAEIVCDMGYTRIQRQWREAVAKAADCPVFAVESDVATPTAIVSPKAEYAARTIRPKIHLHLQRFLVPVVPVPVRRPSLSLFNGDWEETLEADGGPSLLRQLSLDRTVLPVSSFFKGGQTEAIRRFDDFLQNAPGRYVQNRNQPQTEDTSRMSPYLHFGQVSPVYLAWKTANHPGLAQEMKDAFIEELVVRRELAVNFVLHRPDYDRFSCLPAWARASLAAHENDPRPHVYSLQTLEAAQTHDPYWNAAMDEMKQTGYMHNYMRMYWGKKILEWSQQPETAFQTLLYLNNTYFLDGRDPNSYAGAAWIFGLHDRPWPERPIFGTIRYMNSAGLERKCDIRAYTAKIDALKKSQNPQERV